MVVVVYRDASSCCLLGHHDDIGDSMNRQEESPAEAFADAIGMVAKLILTFGVIGGIFYLRVTTLQNAAKEFQEEVGKPIGHLIGRVDKVETWTEDKFTTKEGGLQVTLEITDRTRITFDDGRSKEFLGIPKETVPTDKDVAVVWTKYNILIEIVDAEEYKGREKEEEKKPAEKPEIDEGD
jgi:hypothetical protein